MNVKCSTAIVHQCLELKKYIPNSVLKCVVGSFFERNGGLCIKVQGESQAKSLIEICEKEEVKSKMFSGFSEAHLREKRERLWAVKFVRVPESITEESISEFLSSNFFGTHKILVFPKRGNLVPTGLVKIDFNEYKDVERLFNEGLKIQNQYFPGHNWEDRVRVYQCYRCGDFRHIAWRCPSPVQKCIKCGGNHDFKNGCENNRKCLHCSGPHFSIDRSCPYYQEEVQRVLKIRSFAEREIKNKNQQIHPQLSLNPQNNAHHHNSYSQIVQNRPPINQHVFYENKKQNDDAMLRLSELEKVVGKMAAAIDRLTSENQKLRRALDDAQARSSSNHHELPMTQLSIDKDDKKVAAKGQSVNSVDGVEDDGDVPAPTSNDEEREQ